MRPNFDQRVGPAAVYVFQRHDRRRFKLGWSIDPVLRAQQLPEFKAGLLDLPQSLALWLPSPMRAYQVERSMHDGLAPYRVPPGHDGDGHTEWFTQGALLPALRLLGQMPSGGRHADRLPLTAVLRAAPSSPGVASVDDGAYKSPQHVWWAIEDLLLRLAACLPMWVEREDRQFRVVVGGFRHAHTGPVVALRSHVYNPETYTWHLQGRKGEFVRLIEYRGDDLTILLTPALEMNRWPTGRDLAWQVNNLVGRLAR